MVLLPYKLSFINPIYLAGASKNLESKDGVILKLEKDNITSFADVSPLTYLNTETILDVQSECKNIDTNKIFHDIDLFLETEKENFLNEKFLDFDFSKYTNLPSLKHGLSCLYSEYYRKKFGIQIKGDVNLHGLIPNHLNRSSNEEALKHATKLEKAGFLKAKIKIGEKDNLLLKSILSNTQNLQLRLDANRKLKLSDYSTLLDGLDLGRIDYIEEPVLKTSELAQFTSKTRVYVAIDENINLMKDIVFDKVAAVVIKPTLLGDYYTIKRIIQSCKKRKISAVFSSVFESQVGIYQIAQLAHTFNPLESHGLDTFDLFLEKLMDLNVSRNVITLKENIELQGPIFV